jgi:hypothetical protein
MKPLNILLLALLTTPAAIVYADNSGNTHVTTTDAGGTTVTTKTSHSDSVGNKGERKETSNVQTEVDPKGMLNKEMAGTKEERVRKPNGDFSEVKTIKHADGTMEKVSAERNTDKHWTDTGRTTTNTETHVIDPKGLGNKQSRELEEKVVVAPDGSSRKTVTDEVNSKVISEKTSTK